MATLQEYRDQPHWSFSAINEVLNICSLRWKFRAIDKIKAATKSPSLALGTAVHQALSWACLLRKEGETPSDADVAEVFTESWRVQVLSSEMEGEPPIGFSEKHDPDVMAQQGRDMVTLYNSEWEPEDEVLSVEEAFRVPLIYRGQPLSKPLIGEFDLVVKNNDAIKIVDFKTAAKRWPKNKVGSDMQSTSYLYAHHTLYSDSAEFRFDVLVGNKTPVLERFDVERGDSDFDRFLAKVALVERIVEQGMFMPNDTSFWCGSCPYQRQCASWGLGSTPREIKAVAHATQPAFI